MKRFVFVITLLVFIGLNGPVVAAADPEPDPCKDAKFATENELLPCGIVQKDASGKVGNILPTSNVKTVLLPYAIKVLLGITGALSVVVFVYAGVMLIISQGNEEELTKFKNILIWSIVGLALVTTSYGLVRGIMQLVFT